MTDLTISNTILKQLGGRRFLAMTGAKNLVGAPSALYFDLPATMTKEHINKFRVTLKPDDTYTLEAYRYKPKAMELLLIKKVEGVYFDALQRTFSEMTGLDTHL